MLYVKRGKSGSSTPCVLAVSILERKHGQQSWRKKWRMRLFLHSAGWQNVIVVARGLKPLPAFTMTAPFEFSFLEVLVWFLTKVKLGV